MVDSIDSHDPHNPKDSEQFHLDAKKRRQGFERAADTYDAAAVLQREVGDRLLQRLEYIKQTPSSVLDLGAGTGYISKDLLQRYPKSKLVAVDIAQSMLKKTQQHRHWLRKPAVVCASAEALPFTDDAFDMVISNLMFQWCEDLPRVFMGVNRILKGNSLFTFTTFGPDTMRELRESWSQVDDYEHTSTFQDMHDVGDALMKSGFQQPVVDTEVITLTYQSLSDLMKDLKHIGATNASTNRNRGLTGRQKFKALEKAYQTFRTEEGLYPLTYEVVYGHGWAQAAVEVMGGARIIPITEIKETLNKS